jgi:hypothetical protein
MPRNMNITYEYNFQAKKLGLHGVNVKKIFQQNCLSNQAHFSEKYDIFDRETINCVSKKTYHALLKD